jgi:hypothetical protein
MFHLWYGQMFTNEKANPSEFLWPFIYRSVTLQPTSHILLLLFRIITFHMKKLLEKRQKPSLMSQWPLRFCRKKHSICPLIAVYVSISWITILISFIIVFSLSTIDKHSRTKLLTFVEWYSDDLMNKVLLFICLFLYHFAFIEIVFV